MNDNNFKELYKTWATDELLDIIDNKDDYQPLAVEAATHELASRNLSQEQLAEAKAKQDLRRHAKAKQEQKINDIQSKVMSLSNSITDTVNPIQTETVTTEKTIKLLVTFIVLCFLYQVYDQFPDLKTMIIYRPTKLDFSILAYIIPLVILPLAAILLWLRKKAGWILATIYFSSNTIGTIHLFIWELKRKPFGAPAIDNLYPFISPISYLVALFAFSSFIWALCKVNIREVYKIGNKTMWIALGVGAVIILLMTLSFGL